MHYLLIYDVAPDYLQRHGEFRAAHLALAWDAADRGELVLGGAVESAMLLFCCDSPAVPSTFAQADPYVVNGLMAQWRVAMANGRGPDAANPVRPK